MPTYKHVIENVTYNNTLRLTGDAWDNTLVRNVIIEDVKGDGVFLRDVENVTFENVTVRNVSGDGIKLSMEGSTSNVTISDSHISRIGEDGINAGQRIENGVDHKGLKIVGNTVDQTGLNGGSDGLRHGMYIQSQDVLIENNRVTNSEDGNGISVRSSGIVRDNYVEDSFKSGIAYFSDHMGSGGTLRIEQNTVQGSGYSGGRTDIDLLSITDKANAISSAIVSSNHLEKGAAGVHVGNGYNGIKVDLGMNSVATGNEPADDASVVPSPQLGIIGDNGSNRLQGTSEDDSMTGGGAADVFIFQPGGGNDRIEDFQVGTDRIYLRDFSSFDSARDLVPHASEQNSDTVVDLGNGNSLTIANARIADFSESDFIFG